MCCTGAKWKREVVQDHKFDFVDVHEYHTTGFFTRFRYCLVYVFFIKSVLIYVSDIYTACAMLANNYWSGNILNSDSGANSKTIQVPFTIGKWIFTGCIIFSFLLLAWESRKARMIVKSRDISYAFTNIMANQYYTIRSYDHFCFFSQIDNSKKRKDEFAFFVFFTFKGWKRLLLADAPRQVINGLTLYSFGKAFNWTTDISKYYNDSDGQFSLVRAGILCTMIFTVVMWAGSAVLLTIAAFMYIPLLCYIQGNLKEYCCHKIDKRIAELMKRKTKKRLAREQELAKREAAGDFRHLKDKKGRFKDGQAPLPQPTLPTIDLNDEELYHDGKSEAGHSTMTKYTMQNQQNYGYPPVPSLHDTAGYPRYQLSDVSTGPPGAMDSSYSLAQRSQSPYGNYAYPSQNSLGMPNDSFASLHDDKASIKSRDPLLHANSHAGMDVSQSDLNRAPSYRTQEENDAYFSQMQQDFGGGGGSSEEHVGGGGYGQYHRDEKYQSSPVLGGTGQGQEETPRQYQQGYFEPDPQHPYPEPPYAMDGQYSPRQGEYPPNQQQQQHNPYGYHSSHPSLDSNARHHQHQQPQYSDPTSRSHTPSRSRDLMASPAQSLPHHLPQIHTSRSASPQTSLHDYQQQPAASAQSQLRNPTARGVSIAGRSDVTTFYHLEDRDRQSIADSQAGAFDLDDYARMSAIQQQGQGQQPTGSYWTQGQSGRRSQLDMLDEAEEDLHQDHQYSHAAQQQQHQQQDWRR